MEKDNTSSWDHPALRKDGGKPLQNNGKSAEEIAREEKFWKRVREANKRLGLTSSHPSAVTYLDLLEDDLLIFRKNFLKMHLLILRSDFTKLEDHQNSRMSLQLVNTRR